MTEAISPIENARRRVQWNLDNVNRAWATGATVSTAVYAQNLLDVLGELKEILFEEQRRENERYRYGDDPNIF